MIYYIENEKKYEKFLHGPFFDKMIAKRKKNEIQEIFQDSQVKIVERDEIV